MPIRTRTAIAATMLAAVALVGGCSSSKDDASSSTTVASSGASSSGTTKAAFVTAADALCVKGNAELSKITYGPAGTSLTEGASSLQAQAQVLDTMIAGIKALPQPTGADAPTELYSTVEAMQTTLGQLVQAAQANDETQASKLSSQLGTESDAANRAWDAYGLTSCGSGSTNGQNQQNQNQQDQNQQNQNQQNQNQQNQNQQNQNQQNQNQQNQNQQDQNQQNQQDQNQK